MAIVQNGYHRRVANDAAAPNRIRELREALGISQADLAHLAHVTPSALNKIEMGSRGLDQRWMRRLAPLLGVTPAELLPDEDNPLRLSEDEREFLERYRKANEREKGILVGVTEAVVPYRAPGEKAA